MCVYVMYLSWFAVLSSQIDAKKAMPPEQYKEQQLKNMKTCKIFCGGVPTDLEKEKIEEHFKQYGDVGYCSYYQLSSLIEWLVFD